jgi:CRP-like cAMP-binding protein
MPLRTNAHALFIRQLETVSRFDDEDRRVLRALPMGMRWLHEGRDIFREGYMANECCVILSGVACRYKIVAGGRRQILSFHFAGDMIGRQGLLLEKMDHSVAVLTKADVGFISHDAVRAIAAQRPAIAAAFARQAEVDGSIAREWIANVGRRLALERVSHLICECFERLRALGLADDAMFEFPITQNELGDATGLSNVHINRTMQILRKSGLLVSSGKVHTIPNWEKMQEAGDFNAGYLHLLEPVAA